MSVPPSTTLETICYPQNTKARPLCYIRPPNFFASGGMGGISRLSDSRDLPRARWKALILSGGQSAACLLIPSGGTSHSTLTCSLLKITYGQEYISDKSNEWGDVVYSSVHQAEISVLFLLIFGSFCCSD